MIWSAEIKQLLRTLSRTLAFCLALTLVIGLLNVTFGIVQASERTMQTISDTYITVGTIPRLSYKNFATFEEYKKKGDKLTELGRRLISGTNPKANSLILENVISQNVHSWLAAYDLSLTPLVMTSHKEGGYTADLNRPQNLGLFAVECVSTELRRMTESSQEKGSWEYTYQYQFRVLETGVLHPDLTAPEILTVTSNINFDDDSPIFEEGHTYWVWGNYDMTEEAAGTLELIYDVSQFRGTRYVYTDRWEAERLLYIWQPVVGRRAFDVPLMGEYTGSASEYLARDEAGMWQTLIEILNTTLYSLRVCSADDVRTLHPFSAGLAQLIEGENFTAEDIEQGRRVAMITDVFAEKNGLRLGDSIDLSFYVTLYSAVGNGAYNPSDLVSGDYGSVEQLTASPTGSYASVNDGAYTVVGIIGTNGWSDDYRAVHPNTVIVPQSALEKLYGVSTSYPDMSVSLSIPNGGVDALEEELSTLGYGDLLVYDDGGYSVVMPNVRSIRDSAVFVNSIVIGLWVIVALAVLIFFVLTQIPAGRVKFRLGTGKRTIFGQMTFSTVLMLLVSGSAGCVGSILLYDRALEWMMQSDFTVFSTSYTVRSEGAEMLEHIFLLLAQNPRFFLLTTVTQVGILALLGILLCAIIALRKTGFRQ